MDPKTTYGVPISPGYNNQQPQPGQVFMVPTSTPVIVAAPPLGPQSQSMQCRYCHHHIRTTVTTEPNTKTHMFALLLCLFGCCPCVCVPYCMDSCQSQKHTCPNCGTYLGEYQN